MKTHPLKKIFWVWFYIHFYVKLVLYEIQKYFSENQSGGYDIYASLPRSLKKEVLVRSKVEEDPEVLQARQAIVSSKSPAELSQIHSFSEVPIPKEFEAWMHRGDSEGGNKSV